MNAHAVKALALGRLLRVSLAPSAVGDALAGILIGCGGVFPGGGDTALLVCGSLGVYHGNMALNDWCDRDHDAATRADRPIPSRAITERSALAIAVALMVGGVICAALAAPWAGAWMAGVAVLAATYNRQGRGPYSGPVLLALCRAGNLATGTVYALATGLNPDLAPTLIAMLLYGGYVYQVSRLGRMEDGEDDNITPDRVGFLLFTAASILIAAGMVPRGISGHAAHFPAVLLSILGAYALLSELVRKAEWNAGRVGKCMGLCLRRLLLFSVIFAWNTGTTTGALTAAGLLFGYPVSWSLRRWFPPS